MIIIPYQVHQVIYCEEGIWSLAQSDLSILKNIICEKSFSQRFYTRCKYETFDDLLEFTGIIPLKYR